MSKNNDHIEQLSPDLLKAYHAGELSNSQMHQVEKLMLDDPFYTDALEGLERLSSTELKNDLNALNKRFDQHTEEEKNIFPWFRAIAATVVLAIIGGLFWFNQQSEQQADPIPKLKELPSPQSSPAPAFAEEDALMSVPDDSLDIDTTFIPQVRPDQTLTTQASEPKEQLKVDDEIVFEEEPDQTMLQSAAKVEQPDRLRQVEIAIPMLEFDRDIDSITKQLQGRVAGVQVQQTEQAAQMRIATRNIVGRVIGEDDNLALPGVSVLIKGTTEGTATDQDGNFSLSGIAPNDILVFRYLGYVTQEVTIGEQDSMNVDLSVDAQSLGEVVVTGLGTDDNEEKRINAFARPENGFQDLNRYLRENLRYPEEYAGSDIRGIVTVIFEIAIDGSLDNFRIDKSLGEAFDQEAIRLLRDGPNWEAATDENGEPKLSEMKVRIRFRE